MAERLKREVWLMDRCSGCGACVSACSKNILYFPKDGDHPEIRTLEKKVGLTSVTVDTCFFCERPCEDSCPRLREPEEEAVAKILTLKPAIAGADVVNSILASSLKRRLIDGALVWDIEEGFRPVARVATTDGEVLSTAGYQYLWHPILEALNRAIYRKELKRVAVVGPPCVAQAVKSMRSSDNPRLKPYKDSMRLVVGVFCEGAYKPSIVDEISGRLGVRPYELRGLSMDYRNMSLHVLLRDGSAESINLPDVRRHVKSGCARCTDFTGDCADVSIGKLSPTDEVVVAVVRTPVGEKCINYALWDNVIKPSEKPINYEEVQRLIRYKERRKRAQEVDSLMTMALESISRNIVGEDLDARMRSVWEVG